MKLIQEKSKKLMALLIVCALMVGVFPVGVYAASGAVTGIDWGDNITESKDGNVLTLSGTGDMNDFENEENKNKLSDLGITSVVINDGITSIGYAAFCFNTLTSISMPETLTKIGHIAFAYNALTSITIGGGVVDFGTNLLGNENFKLVYNIGDHLGGAGTYNGTQLGLWVKEQVIDKTALVTALNHGLTDSHYTPTSWLHFSGDITVGTTVNNDVNATQQEVDDAVTMINSARTNLIYSNVSVLQTLVISVNNYVEADYTPESWTSFIAAKTTAEAMRENSYESIASKITAYLEASDLLVVAQDDIEVHVDFFGQNGNPVQTTTNIAITFDTLNTITDMEMANFTLTGATLDSVTKGGTKQYNFSISNITVANGESVIFTFNKDGFNFPDSPYSVVIYKTVPPVSTGITWGANIIESISGNTLTLSGTGDMNDFVTEDNKEKLKNLSITGVVIGNGITSIGNNAFHSNELTSVDISDSVTTIGDYAFHSNKLISLGISDNVTNIGDGAFYGNNTITNLTLGSSVVSIGRDAFYNNNLDNVTIPGSVRTIDGYAFYENGLTSVTLLEGIEKIEVAVFALNDLTNIIIPDSVTSILTAAFATSALTSVTIGQGVDINTSNPGTMGSNGGFANYYNADNQSGEKAAGTYTYVNGAWGKLVTREEDDQSIALAKANIDNTTYSAIQVEVTNEAQALAKAQALVNALELEGTTVTVITDSFMPANNGVDGEYTFSVTIDKGVGTQGSSKLLTMPILSFSTYTVTYDNNGAVDGSIPTDENNYEQGVSVTVLGNVGTLEKPGYTFAGWNTQVDGNGTDRAVGSTFTIGSANVTLYAKWTANVNISDLILSQGVLTPDVDKDTVTYTARVSYSTSSINVKLTLEDSASSLTVNGDSVNSGDNSNSIELNEGSNVITIVTTGVDNTTQKTYTLTITREAKKNSNLQTGELGGKITDGTNPLVDVEVRVMKGGTNGTQYGETIVTNADGEFTFIDIPYGTYSLVGTKGDRIITKAIVIQSSTITQDLEMTSGKQKTLVEVSEGTPSIAANNLDEMFTDEDRGIIGGAVGEVTLKLLVEERTDAEVPADVVLIQGVLPSGKRVGAYFDISMLRTVTGTGADDVNNELVQPPAGKKVLITVDVPEDLRNKAPYQVIRVHNGVAIALDATYNSVLHTLTFEGDAFSVYSIAYTDSSSSGSSSGSVYINSESLADKIIDLVGDTRITPAVIIDKDSEDEIEITLKDTLKDITKDDAKGSKIVLPIVKEADKTTININGEVIKDLMDKESVIVIETPSTSTTLNAPDINLVEFKDEEGSSIALNEITVSIVITSPNKKESELTRLASKLGVEKVLPCQSVEVTMKNGDRVVAVEQLNNYMKQQFLVPEGNDAMKISTAVFIDKKGEMNHVPTQISIINNKYFATVNSLYLGKESYFIWNPTQLKQVEKHWTEDSVNDMASRLVIFEPEKFEPNKAITRADFAEYLVRALGIYREDSIHENNFKDVTASEARALGILIANEYEIVSGYTDGTFRPNASITREEAMTMYQRAMKMTKLTGDDLNRYQNYKDFETVSPWAESYVKEVLSAHVFDGTTATTISPKSNLTYAEAAQAIKNLLVESKLIND